MTEDELTLIWGRSTRVLGENVRLEIPLWWYPLLLVSRMSRCSLYTTGCHASLACGGEVRLRKPTLFSPSV